MTQTNNKTRHVALTYRAGTVEDSYAVFELFEETVADLVRRFGSKGMTSWHDSDALARMWFERRPLYEHLARTADQFWVAEQHERIVGFARSIVSDGLRQLTELFVRPGVQAGGVGRELITRAFPVDESRHRSIIATTDFRAQGLYLKVGVYPRFPIYYFSREPEPVSVTTNLVFEPVVADDDTLDTMARIDKKVLGHRRDGTHRWLLGDRQGYLYLRDDQPVGYGYTGLRNGPFALQDNSDFPAVLAHAESTAARQGHPFGLEVPTINRSAVDYLIKRGFNLDTFVAIMMSNEPYGKFEHYILSSPPFFI
jgi:GNAT superfamily N-acetyltransferase